jgi:hypothetical protein
MLKSGGRKDRLKYNKTFNKNNKLYKLNNSGPLLEFAHRMKGPFSCNLK